MRSRASSSAVCLFLWGSALAGPLKYGSSLLGFPFHLIPKALLLLLMIQHFVFLRATLTQWVIAAGIAATVLIAHDHRIVPLQIAFGLWALSPFFFGMLFPNAVLSERVRRNLPAIFILCVAGECLSYFTVFPWSGMDVNFAGVSTGVAREWSAGSARRLAGFTSSSIDLSVMLGIFGVFFVFRSARFMTRVALMIVVSAAIFETTMKTAAMAFTLACLPLLAPSKCLKVLSGLIGLFFLILGAAIPFSLTSPTFLAATNFVRYTPALESLQERIELTWPNVLDYLRAADAGFWGIGVGGLGSAMSVGPNNSFMYASVDSLYLYTVGTAGLLGCIVLLVFARRLWVEAFESRDLRFLFGLPLLVFFAIYGLTQPLVEVSVGAIFFGALLRLRAQRAPHATHSMAIDRPQFSAT